MSDQATAAHQLMEWVRNVEYEMMICRQGTPSRAQLLFAEALTKAAAVVRVEAAGLRMHAALSEGAERGGTE